MIDPSNIPQELTEPPSEAAGWLAFQPTSGKVWRKLDGTWLPIAEARKLIDQRTSN
ncbi:hypothetical protein [Bradyrhizobium sp. JR3.5]